MCKILKLMDIQDNTNAYNLKDFACSVDIAEKEETDNSHLKKYGSGLEYLEERIKILQDTADSIIKNAEEEAKKIVEKTKIIAMKKIFFLIFLLCLSYLKEFSNPIKDTGIKKCYI